MKAILYIGHGTRSRKGAEEANAFVGRVMEKVDVPIQELCFLELTEPSIEIGFARCIKNGAAEIIAVPMFLLAAGHIKKDIPEILTKLQSQYPNVTVTMRDPFGVQEKILEAMAELVEELTGKLESEDRILIVGRGSSDTEIQSSFGVITRGIQQLLGVRAVSVCYLAAASPNLQEGLEQISRGASGKIIVVPYLLFPGLLTAEVNHEVKRLQRQGVSIFHTGPLCHHRAIEDIVIDRATGK